MGYRIGIDIGGTFTDLTMTDSHGKIYQAKTPSVPTDPPLAMARGLDNLASATGLDRADLLAETDIILHGTTVALNTLLQRRGAKIGLLCTAGFRDSMEIRLGHKEEALRLSRSAAPQPPLIPRYLRLPVTERISKHGVVLTELDRDDVRTHAHTFAENGVEAIAISYLWSFMNPRHEYATKDVLNELLPGVHVYPSADVCPQIREYDRTSTTCVAAYVGPAVDSYIRSLEKFLRAEGYRGELRYTQSNGGISGADSVLRKPVVLANSGPASGPTAGLFFSRGSQLDTIITTDMGGTSFDACLIQSGVTDTVLSVDMDGHRLSLPMVNVNSAAAGGNSIAWIEHGLLRVGPQSAEANPGPVCYMKGGTEPTVTDANVCLGFFNQEALLGGKFEIDAKAAERAIATKLAEPLGITTLGAAKAVYQVVTKHMADTLQQVSLERGHDPRDFAMVVGGGSGAAHCWPLAKSLSVSQVLIPKYASTFCAFGALAADLKHDYATGYVGRLADLDFDAVNDAFAGMTAEGRALLAQENVEDRDVTIRKRIDIRYVNQIYEIPIEISDEDLKNGDSSSIAAAFHAEHQRLYLYSDENDPCEVTRLSVEAVGAHGQDTLRISQADRTGAPAPEITTVTPVSSREALFPDLPAPIEVPVYDGNHLTTGAVVPGPALIEEPTMTIVVFPDAVVDVLPGSVYRMTDKEK